MNAKELQSLDEALNYLNESKIEFINEGLIQKFVEWRENRKKKKAQDAKDKNDIKQRGYTDAQYKSCKEDIESYIKWSENKPLDLTDISNFALAEALYYCNISESEFVKSFNKFVKDEINKVDADDYPFDDDNDPMYKFLQDNEAYEVGNTGGTPYIFYFPKLKKIMCYYNDGTDKPGDAMSYKEFLDLGEDYMTRMVSSSIQNQYVKAYAAVDKDLGYNRLK